MRKPILITAGLICMAMPAWALQGQAVIKGTASDSKISGEATLTEEKGGLTLEAKVSNVPPGKHGFHVHEVGSCDDMGKAAGGHFNPDKSPHGLYPKDGSMKAMAGDMGNIEVGADGTGTFKVFMPMLTLSKGKYAVMGKSLILHEKEDDFSQPSGNAGARIGCGIILPGGPETAAAAKK
jgi:Cu-Zn family superoxide dismutase